MDLEQASLEVLQELGGNSGYFIRQDNKELSEIHPRIVIQRGETIRNAEYSVKKPNKLKYALAIGLVAIGTLGMAGCVSFGDNAEGGVEYRLDDDPEFLKNEHKNSEILSDYEDPELIFSGYDCIHPNPQELMLCKPEFKENLTYLTEKIGMDYTKELSAYLRYLTDKGPVTKEWIDQNMEIYRDILIIEEERGNFNRLEHVKGYLDILKENGFNTDATNIITIESVKIGPPTGGGGFTDLPEDMICDRMYAEECWVSPLVSRLRPYYIEYNEEVFIPCVLVHEDYHNQGYWHKVEGHNEIIDNAEKECVKTLEKVFNEKYQIG